MKLNKKKKDFLLGIAAGLFGLIVMGMGVRTFVNQGALIRDGLTTTAVVIELRIGTGGMAGGATTSVIVEYTIDGVTYQNRLRVPVRDTYVGEEILIHYGQNNPRTIIPVDAERRIENRRAIASLILGALMVGLGLLGMTDQSEKRKKKRN